jgi:hypothetical protein
LEKPISCKRNKGFVCADQGVIPFIIAGNFFKTHEPSAFLTVSGCHPHSGGDSFLFKKSGDKENWNLTKTEETFNPTKCWKFAINGEPDKLLCVQDLSYAYETLHLWTASGITPIVKWAVIPNEGFNTASIYDEKSPQIRQAELKEMKISGQNTESPQISLEIRLETAVLPVTADKDALYFIDKDEEEIKKNLKVENIILEWKYNRKLQIFEPLKSSVEQINRFEMFFGKASS